jgi:hypothetical protein
VQNDARITAEFNSSAARRRLPIIAILAVISALVALITYSFLWEPLNQSERSILGEWTFAAGDDPAVTRHIVFHPDRTFQVWKKNQVWEKQSSGNGTWEISEGWLTLYLPTDDSPSPLLPTTVQSYLEPPYPESFTVVEITRNRARLQQADNTTIEFQRVPGKE